MLRRKTKKLMIFDGLAVHPFAKWSWAKLARCVDCTKSRGSWRRWQRAQASGVWHPVAASGLGFSLVSRQLPLESRVRYTLLPQTTPFRVAPSRFVVRKQVTFAETSDLIASFVSLPSLRVDTKCKSQRSCNHFADVLSLVDGSRDHAANMTGQRVVRIVTTITTILFYVWLLFVLDESM